MCSVCMNKCFVRLWNFRRIPSLGVLILTEVEVTEDERKREICSTCWQGVLVSEGHLRSPGLAGRSFPCGLCSEGKEKKRVTLAEQQQLPVILVISLREEELFITYHLLPPLGKLLVKPEKLQLPTNQAASYRVETFDNEFQKKRPLIITLFGNKIPSCITEVCPTNQGCNSTKMFLHMSVDSSSSSSLTSCENSSGTQERASSLPVKTHDMRMDRNAVRCKKHYRKKKKTMLRQTDGQTSSLFFK